MGSMFGCAPPAALGQRVLLGGWPSLPCSGSGEWTKQLPLQTDELHGQTDGRKLESSRAGDCLRVMPRLSGSQGRIGLSGTNSSPALGQRRSSLLAPEGGHCAGGAFVLPEIPLVHLFRTELEPVLKAQSKPQTPVGVLKQSLWVPLGGIFFFFF